MSETNTLFRINPLAPWDETWGGFPAGNVALAVVAVVLVALTLWTYLGHPQSTRRRVTIILVLRLLALLVALLTALRPSVGVPRDRKPEPTTLTIDVDVSESMTVKDEVANQSRIDAVRRALKECEPIIKELEDECRVETRFFEFSTPESVTPEPRAFDPGAPPTGLKSDYGAFLKRLLAMPFASPVRAHVLIGDGADNADGGAAALALADEFGRRQIPIVAFTTGSSQTTAVTRDIIVRSVSFEDAPDDAVPIKTEFTVVADVDVFGFSPAELTGLVAQVYLDDKPVVRDAAVLPEQKGNKVRVKVKAPDNPGQVRVRVRIGRPDPGKDDPLALPNEKSDRNNDAERYLRVTKDGVRVLIIDRYRPEETRIRDALRPVAVPAGPKKDPAQPDRRGRFDVYEVMRQANLPPTSDEKEWLDLDKQGYDVVLIGNLSFAELDMAGFRLSDGKTLPEKITERVAEKGMGLMFLGGEQAYTAYPPPPAGDPTIRPLVLTDLLPVVPGAGIEDQLDPQRRPLKTYQTVPTAAGLDQRVLLIAKGREESAKLWDRLNGTDDGRVFQLSGYNRFTPKAAGLATVYAYAWPGARGVVAQPAGKEAGVPPGGGALLVGQQIGAGNRGRVLAFGGFDTNRWERLGQPKTREGIEIHDRFWRQCVLWLAHLEDDEGQLWVRPEQLTPPVGRDVGVRLGVKAPGGGDEPNPTLWVKVLAPGEYDRADLTGKSVEALLRDPASPAGQRLARALAAAPPREVKLDKDGSKVVLRPTTPGEHVIVAASPHKKPDGQPALATDAPVWARDAVALKQVYIGEGRFIARQEETDEMLAITAQPDFMQKLEDATRAAGTPPGKPRRLAELPAYLRGLKEKLAEKEIEYRPEWKRDRSKWFLPTWLVVFATILCTEWGLRRMWGMV